MRLIAFACLLPIALSAQPPGSASDLCSIEGRVVNALTGEPLKKATLRLNNVDPASGAMRTPLTTVSGPDGSFAMKDILAGTYSLWADRFGFLRAEYGARTPHQRGTTLRLSQGQTMKELTIQMTPQGVVSGRVVDEDGDPVQGAQIRLLRLSYSHGRKQLVAENRWPGTTTNDLSEFRIFGLRPGRYVLAATYYAAATSGVDHSAELQDNQNYLPTYYPGTADPSAAIQIEVQAGAEVRGIDVRLLKVHAVTVSGRAINNALPGRHIVMVSLLPNKADKIPFQVPSDPADASSRFVIRGVVPGSYRLRASISAQDNYYWTEQPLEVRDQDIENVNVTVSRGVPVTGLVRTDAGGTVDWERVSFNLQPTDGDGGYSFTREGQGFRFDSVNPGHYYLRANLPDGLFVKAVRSGDVDALTAGIEVGSDPIPPLDVVLSSNPGLITGVVQNPDTHQPAPFSSVTLVPQEKERRDQQWYYKTVTADRSGAFTLKNVAPGEYRIYAWDEIEDGAYMDPDFLKPYEAKSESISIKEGDTLTQQVTSISAAPSALVAAGHSQ